ncbi:oxidoreductase [Acidaminococcus sp.]|uniref:oxidoreductase n=1 Tax=Acidaminococcus sp. TaxID=1872103 RepID=UPI003AB68B44
MQTWLITGCSSGLGRGFAKAALKSGDQVIVTARRVETLKDLADAYPEQVLALSLDVTKEEDIKNAVEKGLERFGTIDILINNAGYGYRAAVEEGVPKEVDQLFRTNLFGPIALIKAVLPIMRKNHCGTIVNVSSIAALGAALGSGYYAATKSALESIAEALYGETKDLGIHVMIIEPGAFRTKFAGTSLKESSVELAYYEKTAGTRRIRNDHTDGTQQGNPDEAGRVLVDLVHRGKMPLRLLLGSDAQAYGKSQLTARLDEYKAWEVTSNRTDFKE